jgi:ribosomal protein S18 acetylase RimI-like enzyme
MNAYKVRPLTSDDRDWAVGLIEKEWGSRKVVTRGIVRDVVNLDGFIALQSNEPIGLLTFWIEGEECEIITLNSLSENIGVGTGLIDSVKVTARESGCRRIWLITTNDNLAAVRFYQKRGFSMVAVYPGAIEQSRRLKPEIPLIGIDGIPLRDEIELEILL